MPLLQPHSQPASQPASHLSRLPSATRTVTQRPPHCSLHTHSTLAHSPLELTEVCTQAQAARTAHSEAAAAAAVAAAALSPAPLSAAASAASASSEYSFNGLRLTSCACCVLL